MTGRALVGASAPWSSTRDVASFVAPPGWVARAVCTADPDLHFSGDHNDINQAKKVCTACPVRVECLLGALDRDEPAGVWGGFTPEERGHLNVEDAAAAPVEPVTPTRPVQDLVLEYLQAHIGLSFTVYQVAKAVGRHPRSVEHTLNAMTAAAEAVLVGGQPRRYAAAGGGAVAPAALGHGDVIRVIRAYVLDRPGVSFTAAELAVALPDLKPRSVSRALASLAGDGELNRSPGRPARYTSPAGGRAARRRQAEADVAARRRSHGEPTRLIAVDLGVSPRTVQRRLAACRPTSPKHTEEVA